MVQVTVSTNTVRKTVIVDVNSTINDILDEAAVNVGNAALHLDGSIVGVDEWSDTLNDFGVEDESSVSLVAIVKADSAGCKKRK